MRRRSGLILFVIAATLGEGAAAQAAPGPRSSDPRKDLMAVLGADGPHASIASQAQLFDRFIGTWDCDYSYIAEDGTVTHQAGELVFGWIIDGRAVQDIWVGYPTKPGEERFIGTSVRFYDAKAGSWRVVFVAPAASYVRELSGGAEGDHIVLRGSGPGAERSRWTFSDITPGSFTWRGEKSKDEGKTWKLREEHHMTRRN